MTPSQQFKGGARVNQYHVLLNKYKTGHYDLAMSTSNRDFTEKDLYVVVEKSDYDALLVEAKKMREAFDELFTSAYSIGGEHQLRISKIDYNHANDALASFDKYIKENVK
jgi:hypothetical protein